MSTLAAQGAAAASHADRQRDRILDAAERCFIERGFHAAGMAGIAETAGVSPGLIYRYFAGKREIVLAIIARQLEAKRANIAALASVDELARRLEALFGQWQRGDPTVMSAALLLDMSAEATRDPEIAVALGQSDRDGRDRLAEWMRQVGAPGDDAELDARVLMLQCLMQGLALRAAREPGLDATRVSDAVARLLPLLLGR